MKWTLATAAVKLKRRTHGDLPCLWVMTDDRRMADPVAQIGRLPRGAALIFRHYAAAARSKQAAGVRAWCRSRDLRFVMAATWEMAAQLNADGLHLPEGARLPPGARLWLRQKNRVLTVAAHGAASLQRAIRLGADAVIFSPVFPTVSHPERPALGVVKFTALIRRAPIAVIALGGITTTTVQRLQHSGAAGIAGIGFAVEKN